MIKENLRLPYQTLWNSLNRLEEALEITKSEEDLQKIRLCKDATIQRFEFTVELFWKFLKKALYSQGIESYAPKDVLRKAYACHMIMNEQMWIQMMEDRNRSSHVYQQSVADDIFARVDGYLTLMKETHECLKDLLLD